MCCKTIVKHFNVISVSTGEASTSASCSGNGNRAAFVAPAPPPPPLPPPTQATSGSSTKKPATTDFLPPPTAATATPHKDATLIELLKRGTKVTHTSRFCVSSCFFIMPFSSHSSIVNSIGRYTQKDNRIRFVSRFR